MQGMFRRNCCLHNVLLQKKVCSQKRVVRLASELKPVEVEGDTIRVSTD